MPSLGTLISSASNNLYNFAAQGSASMSNALVALFKATTLSDADKDVVRSKDGRPSLEYFNALKESTNLPTELIIDILDYAEFWLSSGETTYAAGLTLRVQNGKKIVAQTPSLSLQGVKALRRVVFRITSKDQGWSSEGIHNHGTYNGSYTWHEGSITQAKQHECNIGDLIRPEVTIELQRNRHAGRRFEEYCIPVDRPNLDPDHLLKEGSRIILLACAQFPGWTNQVAHASIEVQFADMFEEDIPDLFILP